MKLSEEAAKDPLGPYFFVSLLIYFKHGATSSSSFDEKVGTFVEWGRLCHVMGIVGSAEKQRKWLKDYTIDGLIKELFELGYIEEAMKSQQAWKQIHEEFNL